MRALNSDSPYDCVQLLARSEQRREVGEKRQEKGGEFSPLCVVTTGMGTHAVAHVSPLAVLLRRMQTVLQRRLQKRSTEIL